MHEKCMENDNVFLTQLDHTQMTKLVFPSITWHVPTCASLDHLPDNFLHVGIC